MEIASDRRQKRTHIRQLALQYQLERSVADFALNSIAIADQDGFLLASSDNTNFSEALAAYAPLLSTSGSWDSETVEASLQSENPMVRWPDITIRPFRASGHKMYLCAVGKSGTDKEIGIYRSILGVRRIMLN